MTLTTNARRHLGAGLANEAAATEIAAILNTSSVLSAAEAGFLDGVTAGTGAASKALVLDASNDVTMPDLGSIGFGGVGKFSWDTTDANANKQLIQLPAGGAVDVPVIVIGQSIEAVDMAIHDGITEPTVCILGVGAVATGPRLEFRKSRGSAAAPTVVTSADDIGQIDAYACVAAGEFVRSAQILFECTGTPATTRGPGVVTIKTATDAAPSVLTTALVVSAAQVVTLTAGVTTGNHTFSSTITGSNGVGSAGEQLQSAGAGVQVLWGAAGSIREVKNVIAEVSDRAEKVLARLLGTNVYQFTYKPDVRPSTGDTDTVYTGVMAEELEEVMHHEGRIFSPVSAFGQLLLAIKALAAKVERLEAAM